MNKILMVEEEKGTIEKAEKCLSQAGFEMLSAFDGLHGFQMAKDRLPDLIITDAVIPLMSGYELCKAIKQDEDTKSIPLVVLTEKHRMEDAFMFLGVKDFLNKPVNMIELENIVRNKLNLSQIMQLQKTKILINGIPEILSSCQQLIKGDPHWAGYFSYNKDSFLRDAIKYAPDVIFMDLLMPEVATDELILKLKLMPELKNTVILTYYTNIHVGRDPFAIKAQMIEVQYMKLAAQEAGAREYLGPFNPLTFLNLINIYRKDFEV